MTASRKILLVDPDQTARETLREAVAALGYAVDVADSLQHARQRIAEAEYAVVFADLRLRDGSGLELIESGDSEQAGPMVIVTTKEASLQSSMQAVNRGARGYLVKPYHKDEVQARAKAAIKEFESLERHSRELDRVRQQAEFYQRLAMMDSLTGLFNHRYFRLALRREVEASCRYGRPVSLILMDADRFKRFNDTFGHDAGDHCLRHIARVVRRAARDADIVVRWGGEEFAVILPETSLEGALRCARRICNAVRLSSPPPLQGRHLPGITVSIGVASFTGTEADGEALFHAADAALYEAKRAGGDCVVCAGQDLARFSDAFVANAAVK